MSPRLALRPLLVALFASLPLLAGTVPAAAQATNDTTRETQPFFFDDINPCTGEHVFVSGELQITNRVTFDANGGAHFNYTLVPSQVRGVGESGAVYKAVGGERGHFNLTAGDTLTDTYTNTFNLIGQGEGQNLIVHTTIHVTINADGDLTADVLLDSVECRG